MRGPFAENYFGIEQARDWMLREYSMLRTIQIDKQLYKVSAAVHEAFHRELM